MTSTPEYGFRIGKSAGPMQQAIGAGNTAQIRALLSKRFPGLEFKETSSDAEEVDKPEEVRPAGAPTMMGLRRGPSVATLTAGGETVGDIYDNYVINMPSTVRNLVTTDYKGVRGSRLGAGNYTTESIVPGAQVAAPSIPAPTSAAPTQKQPELPAPAPQVPISIQYGASTERFGHEDYWQNLAKGATPEQLKAYVQQNVGLLSEGNRPGAGGLYDEIMSGKVRTNWEQPAATAAPNVSSGAAAAQIAAQFAAANPGPQAPGPVTTQGRVSSGAGASAEAFGHADVAAARARGASTQEILSFVNANQGLLRGQNVPGGGGLYDQLLRGQI